jgi:ATP-binding cassette subfamily B (MDR/TAP) protein 1
MVSRGLFGWSPPHVQPLTPVSETSEPPESPSPYAADFGSGDGAPPGPDDDGGGPGLDDGDDDGPEPPPAAVPFKRLFACADRLDWALMAAGGVAAAAHGVALVVYLHLFGKAINSLHGRHSQELFDNIKQVGRPFLVTADLKATRASVFCLLCFVTSNLDSVEWDTCASFILVDLLKRGEICLNV